MKTELKEAIFQFCEATLCSKRERIEIEINKIQESLRSETKNSAGDKHETGRAMMQLEREKLGQQLLEVEQMQQVLHRVDITKQHAIVATGNLVTTDKNRYFISISVGKFEDVDPPIFCISANTPIAQLLMGKSVDEQMIFNGISQKILKIE